MIPLSLAVWSSKGGVSKTTISINLGAMAARGGWRVLIVDFDPQGNVVDGLGIDEDDRYDGGASLVAGLTNPEQLLVMADVRPGLDVVPGGPLSEPLAGMIHSLMANQPGDAFFVIDRMLEPIADRYDLILFDLPPTPSPLHNAALTSLAFIVVPTATDKFARGSLGSGFERYRQIKRVSNPQLEILAAVVGKHELRLKRQWELAVEEIRDVLGDHVVLIEPPIRYSQAADGDMKEAGLVASEYAMASRYSPKERVEWLKKLRVNQSTGDPSKATATPQYYSKTAAALAEDYDKVLSQVLILFQDAVLARDGVSLEEPESENLHHLDDKLPNVVVL